MYQVPQTSWAEGQSYELLTVKSKLAKYTDTLEMSRFPSF